MCQSVACWNWWPTLNIVASSNGRPMICIPIGSPSGENPHGTDIDGRPVRLGTPVYCYSQNPSQGVGAGMLSKGYLIAIPATPTSNEQRDALNTELTNIAAGRADPKAGLDKAAAKMTDIMTTG